jgi:uncharacterized membrane protein
MNKNIFIIAGVIVVLGVLAIAQTGNSDLVTGMLGYKVAGGSGFILCFAVLKLLVIALVSFIFSVIFWSTHKWIMKKR